LSRARPRLVRLAILLGLLGVTFVVAELTGLRKAVTLERVRELIRGAGTFGVALYFAVFVIGELVHVPGLVFVAAGVAIWGRLPGGILAWVGSVISVGVSFVVVRAIGGQALAEVRQRHLVRLMSRLERAPISTVALLRAVLVISPPVTYALALAPIRLRDFLIGSALGLVPPLTLAAIFFDQLLRWLG
jgi:uncharacterized membrane protein YdjX (TVP38/TMEM64 family)